MRQQGALFRCLNRGLRSCGFLSCAALLAACAYSDPETADAVPTETSAVALDATEVRWFDLEEPIRGTGVVAAQKTTNVGPRVDGIIQDIQVQVGDRVAQGQVLFRTRNDEYRNRVEQARAAQQLAQAEADKAQLDLDRSRRLLNEGVSAQERADTAETAHRIAQARLEDVRVRLAEAERELDDTTVRAPYSGVITQRFVDEGAMVRTMMSSNSPVVQIMKTDIVVAIVHVAEVHLPRIAQGTPARVTIDGLNRQVDSEVHIINDRVEHSSHSVELRLGMRNPDLAIKPGLFARAELFPPPRRVLAVPRVALLGSPEHRHVFVAVDGVAVRRDVEVREAESGGALIEVQEGLEEGEIVLMGHGLASLSEGRRVTLTLTEGLRTAPHGGEDALPPMGE